MRHLSMGSVSRLANWHHFLGSEAWYAQACPVAAAVELAWQLDRMISWVVDVALFVPILMEIVPTPLRPIRITLECHHSVFGQRSCGNGATVEAILYGPVRRPIQPPKAAPKQRPIPA